MARVVLTEEAVRGFEAVPNAIHRRIHFLLARLRLWPDVAGARPFGDGSPDIGEPAHKLATAG